jgi:hypothetical protein
MLWVVFQTIGQNALWFLWSIHTLHFAFAIQYRLVKDIEENKN